MNHDVSARPDDGLLPPIETWWPYLTPGAHHALAAAPDAPFSARLREEIGRAVGTDVPSTTTLTAHDRRFLARYRTTAQ